MPENKWDSLSMRDKRDMIRLHISNGIKNLNNIKDSYNEYADGGDVINYGTKIKLDKPIDKTDSQPEKIDINNWLRTRRSTGRYNDQIGGTEYNRQITNMYNSEELTPFDFHKRIVKDENPKISEKNLDKKALKYYESDILSGVRGAYSRDNNTIYVEDGSGTSSRKTHEFGHSLNATPQENKISTIVKQNDPYLDDPSEVYSRLMEFRMNNKLNPRKIYNEKDLDELINNPKTKDSSDAPFIKRYDKKTILRLLNEVAENKANNNAFENNPYT